MEEYDADREQVIGRSKKAGLHYMLTVATEEKYFARVLEIIESHEMIYGHSYIHSSQQPDFTDTLLKDQELLLA